MGYVQKHLRQNAGYGRTRIQEIRFSIDSEINSTNKNNNDMGNQNQQCKEYISTISLGTELFVNSKVGERTLKAYTRGEAHGDKFAEICKKNKTSVWIKLNNGEIIKEVHPSTFKSFLKDSGF
jgi:hypothetical protein